MYPSCPTYHSKIMYDLDTSAPIEMNYIYTYIYIHIYIYTAQLQHRESATYI